MARVACPQAAKNWWAEHSQTLCRLGEVFLTFASGVLTIVSFGSPFWIEGGDTFDHLGLWQECQSSPEAKCSLLELKDNFASAVVTTRVMMCLALVCGLVAWAVSIAALLIHKPKILFPAAAVYGLQVLWMFIGLTVYVAVFQALGGTRGWSYTVGWLALVLSLTCCIYFIIVAWYRLKHPDSIRPKMQQIYAPLTQFEDDITDSDDDDEDL